MWVCARLSTRVGNSADTQKETITIFGVNRQIQMKTAEQTLQFNLWPEHCPTFCVDGEIPTPKLCDMKGITELNAGFGLTVPV